MLRTRKTSKIKEAKELNDKQESERSFLDEIDQVIFVTFLEKDKLYYQQHINKYFPGYKEFRELQISLNQKEKQRMLEMKKIRKLKMKITI
ncbi:hypothetical protein RFI_25483 [Reticulomyxa filosa]|uniref:Uncharacterized protein n=1 Tax=Reticulomyxa filosa TaxID=46433 RepID=X6MD25_RETFI|nr:hypothetical protein RFI_25483 [Reticulomyxa filosa]|eukprot:ETO11893.1 hypothetical protein RFI_25483 [Reticulomyxa filosa]